VSGPSARTKRAAVIAALLCLGTCAVLRSRKAPSTASAPLPPEPPPATVTPSGADSRAPARTATPAARPAAPIIDAVILEKDEVCEGEENLVTVRAHTPDGNDAFLHYQVGPNSGSPAAVRSYFDDRGRPTPHRVTVFGKNNVATSVELPPYRVRPCDPSLAAVIERRLRANTLAEFDFDVTILDLDARNKDGSAPTAFRPRVFRWSFGDGKSEETREPHATHDFSQRPQSTLYSQLLVTVEAIGEDGKSVKGRQSLELLNPAFEAFAYKGIVQLFSELEPRFPVLSQDGVVEQGVRLWHLRPEAVEITKVTVTRQYVDGAGRSPPETVSPSSVIGTTQIPPGRGLELRVVLDTRHEPDTFSRDYYLEGKSREGHAVRGTFSVMQPPPRPTKERHQPITDPMLVAKVKIAREVLQREYVTDEDLWALERAGKFAHLRPDPSAMPRAAPPVPVGPKPGQHFPGPDTEHKSPSRVPR
jgi:hypothetical protein